MINTPFDRNNVAIYMARQVVKNFVSTAAQTGQMQEIALDRRRAVGMLCMTQLSTYIMNRQVTVAMVERWLMEAISTQSSSGFQKHNIVTGQVLYQAFSDTCGATAGSWYDLEEVEKAVYSDVAAALMEQLGLCFSCGTHPADGQLHEITGERLCSDCILPPQES